MAQFIKNYVQDLAQDIQIRHCGTLIFNEDTDSNVINVSLYNGQEEAPQSGSVACAVICSDGSTVPVTGGTISGNTVSVTLGADGLIPGQVGIGIQVISGDVKTTVFKAVYSVELFETDTVVDPSSRITISVGELVSDIETAVASIPADFSDLLAAIAPTFSTSTAYASGSYVWYSGHLYRFTAAHSAGAWIGTDATQDALANDVSDLKSAIKANDGWEEITGWSVNKRYYNLSGTTVDISSPSTSTGNCHCVAVPASGGDQFTITATGGTNSRAYGFVASDGTILEKASSNIAISNRTVIAPINTAYLVINDTSLTGRSYYGVTPVSRFEKQDEFNKGTRDVVWQEISSSFEWSSGVWNFTTGTAGTNNTRIRTSLPTISGLNYYVKADDGVVFYLTFYNESDTFVSRNDTPFVSECYISGVAPSGATGFRLTAKTIPESDISSSISTVSAKIHFYTAKALDKYQGVGNAGLSMVVDVSGNVVPGVSAVEKNVESIKKITDMITLHESANLCNPAEIVIGRLADDGTIDTTITSNKTTGFIEVKPGDGIRLYRNVDGSVAAIYRNRTAAYDANKSLVDYKDSASNGTYTVPAGAAYVRMSFDGTYTPMAAIDYTGTAFVDYYDPYITTDDDFVTQGTLNYLTSRPMLGKVVVNFGDSIFGNFRSETSGNASESISHMVAMMTGATCHNVAFGGTHAKTMTGTAREPMDFQSLVTAIISGVWTDQEAYATAQGADYLARVQALEAIDFSTIDVITVSYGTNDWSSQVTPDQYEAALTDGITRLQTAYPQLLCVICTPVIRFKHSDDSGDDDAEDSGGESEGTGAIISSDTIESSSGYKLPQYAEKVESVGHAMHCPVCENYWTLGINLQNYSTFMGGMAAADLVHPNAKGRRLIANHLADALIRM